MSSKDLNIIERGVKGQAWTAEKGKINAGDLAKVMEQRTNNSSALNALPTPFARFFVVKEAFRRILDDYRNGKDNAGKAYERLVSDTLDIYELLYNLNYHNNNWSYSIKIKEWNASDNMVSLKNSIPILGQSIENYIKDDLRTDRFFFVILEASGKEYLIATTSPITGFVTPPDLDKKDNKKQGTTEYIGKRYLNMPILKRKGNGNYFKNIQLFSERDKDFKNYMFKLFDNAGDEFKEIRDYIKQHGVNNDSDLDRNWSPNIKPILSEDNNELAIGNMHIGQDCSISTINFFTDHIIMLPYKISNDNFICMESIGSINDDCDYLIPLKADVLKMITGDLKISYKRASMSLEVTVEYGGRCYSKKYTNDQIISMKKECLNLNMAIFPNILSENDKENNYFKIQAVLSDSNTSIRSNIDDLNINFYRNDEKNNEWYLIGNVDRNNNAAQFGVYPAVVRTRQNIDKGLKASSKFYEVFNSKFDAIDINININGEVYTGMVFPKWNKSKNISNVYTYAVDLGTTNTYISSNKMGDGCEPEQLCMKAPAVSYLHYSKPDRQRSMVDVIESGFSDDLKNNFISEFVPAMIDGNLYKFPIRTAFCVTDNENKENELFDRNNIAFFYGKKYGLSNQTILTEIKWIDDEEKLRYFIRELLLLIKADLLQKQGVLSKTTLIWFKPLNFKGSTKEMYIKIWNEEAERILNISSQNIKCISESEAPYYYFNENGDFKSVDSVSIVDIGGGSCDYVYFKDGKPIVANSVNFGCDILWSNGFCAFTNDRSNGIYNRYKELISFDGNKDIDMLNKTMIGDKRVSTKEIINLWLSNSDKCDIIKKLKADYKPLFLYHLSAIIYYMAKMYKVEDLTSPREVLFCGNGSRYIDLISSDNEVISSIVTKVFESVYGKDILPIHVILPTVRKESTCYGGLYRKNEAAYVKERNYQGGNREEYKDVAEITSDFQNIKNELLKNIKEFQTIYSSVLYEIGRIGEIEISKKYRDNMNMSDIDIKDSIDKNFQTQIVDKYTKEEEYHDSIFFFPIIDNVFKLTKI